MIDTQLRILLIVVAVLILWFLYAIHLLRKESGQNARIGYTVFSVVLWIILIWTIGNILKGM